jgi:hypothetical protein
MTNSQSKFRSVVAAFLSLIVFAAIIAGVYLDLNHTINYGNHDQLQHRLILLTVLMSLPGVITAFLLGFSVRLVTNPKTRWLVPSILVGAGVGITFRAVANKVQLAEKPRIRVPLVAASPKQAEPLAPPKEAIALDEAKAAPTNTLKGFKYILSAPVRWLNQSPSDVVKETWYKGHLVEPERRHGFGSKTSSPVLKNSNYHDNHREP